MILLRILLKTDHHIDSEAAVFSSVSMMEVVWDKRKSEWDLNPIGLNIYESDDYMNYLIFGFVLLR